MSRISLVFFLAELSPAGTETENLLADAYAHERKDDTSLDEYLSEQELDDDNLTEQDFNNRSNSEDSTLTAPQSSILDQVSFHWVYLALILCKFSVGNSSRQKKRKTIWCECQQNPHNNALS